MDFCQHIYTRSDLLKAIIRIVIVLLSNTSNKEHYENRRRENGEPEGVDKSTEGSQNKSDKTQAGAVTRSRRTTITKNQASYLTPCFPLLYIRSYNDRSQFLDNRNHHHECC